MSKDIARVRASRAAVFYLACEVGEGLRGAVRFPRVRRGLESLGAVLKESLAGDLGGDKGRKSSALLKSPSNVYTLFSLLSKLVSYKSKSGD